MMLIRWRIQWSQSAHVSKVVSLEWLEGVEGRRRGPAEGNTVDGVGT